MQTHQINSAQAMITIRLTASEKEKFKLYSDIMGKPLTHLIKELIDRELKSRKLNASEIRKLPKESRSALLRQMTEEALPVYKKYQDELAIDETGDGIE
jgi:hemolysin-activating ACP:hemolysin acyltransferase